MRKNNINSPSFVENFVMEENCVGIVGNGYIGKAVAHFFQNDCITLVYDKFDPSLHTLEQVVEDSNIIFVAVPTPMNKDGSCHTGIVESVLMDIKNVADAKEISLNEFIVVIKSTITPGFTQQMKEKYNMRVVFSPEFLTEANSIQDFENTNRVLLGGSEEDAKIVFKFFEKKLDGKAYVVQCDSKVAEMVKLFANGILATKVIYGNEMYQLCQKLNVDYNEVKVLACLDQRIGYSHLNVPGPDGRLGFSGSCFPKDINHLKYLCNLYGTEEKLISAVTDRNVELRPEKDWEQLKGRAVVDE